MSKPEEIKNMSRKILEIAKLDQADIEFIDKKICSK